MSRAFYCILWAFVLLEALEVARGHPEYRALIPNGNAVTWHGASWVGVGHFASAGGGPRNPFGQHFAAAGYNWTRSLCLMDSDGDGWSNGLELGDPDCLWKAGSGLPPSRTSCITHPGLADDRPTPECTAMLTAAAGGPAMNTIPSSPSMVVPASTGKPENWCGERRAAGQLPTVWHTLPLPTTSLIAQSDIYTCYKFELPAEEDIPDDMDLVAVQIAHDSGLHLHHIFVMHCDPDMHWIEDAVDEPYMCKIHSGSLLASCHALWTAPRISADMDCAKPGHILANAGDLRRRGKGIVAQAHWSFGGRTLGQPIIITNSSVGLGFVQRSMQIPEPEQVGHYYFSAILGPNPQTGNYQPLAIPPQQQAYEVDYECGRRCSLVPLRGNPAKPQKYVTILGYRFHMHYHGVNMSIRIKRCPNNYNGESDVEWRVDGFNVAFQPIYEVTNGVKLYAGDTVEWSCTYNTMSVNTTVYGGYGFSVDEMCQGSLVYYPAVDSFTGCYADQYDNNVCSYEVTAMIKEHDKYDEDFPMRRFLDPWSAGPFSWSVGWKATWLAVMVLGTTALLWGMHFLMLWFSRFKTSSGHTFVGPITHTPPLRAACPKRGCVSFRALASRLKSGLAFIGQRYTACSTKHRRNVCMYITRLVLTTPGFFIMAWLMLLQWCLCGDLAMQLRSVQLMVSLLVAMYLCEILWKTGLDPLILAHHMTTVAIIIVIGMELIWRTSKSCDVLLVMALFAYLEQPFMLSLVFYRLAPEWRGLATMWTFSTWFFTLSKLLSVGVGVWLMWLRWDVMPTWTRVVYPLCWVAMSVLQGINARIQFAITRKIRNRLQETSSKRGSCRDGDSVGLPDKDSSEQGKERCPSLDTVCYVPSSATEALEGTVCDAVAGRGPHGEKGGGSVTPGSTTTISSLEGVIDVPIHNESNNVSVVQAMYQQ